MAWIAVDEGGDEYMYDTKPKRGELGVSEWQCQFGNPILVPKGTAKKLLGHDLSWDDEPEEIK